MSFGIIYIYPLLRKPCICKKQYESQNAKYSLKEGDIYYRYGGRSERIRYTELNNIINSTREAEERQWVNFIKHAARIGISNACILDLDTGVLSGRGGSLIIDENLLSQIAFIKEGEFVERNGKPTLKVIGELKSLTTGKIVVKETTKKVVKAIESSDVIRAFLDDKKVDEPMEYLKAVCSTTSAYHPVYFLLKMAKKSKEEAVQLLRETTSRETTKRYLIDRLDGKTVPRTKISLLKTEASIKKLNYRNNWLVEDIDTNLEDLSCCLDALLSLDDRDICNHEAYIRKMLLEIYDNYYEQVKSNVASILRKTICRVDEALFYTNDNGKTAME